MRIIKEVFDKSCRVCNIMKKGKCIIANVDGENVVIKEKGNHNTLETYKYLSSRNFNYFPIIKREKNNYNVYEYIEDADISIDQKAFDMMHLLSLLHNKTTFYKEMDMIEYKEIFEDLTDKINTTYNFYTNLITLIESHIFMSPSEYLIARNISKIFGALEYSKRNLEEWYNIIKNTAKKRVVLLYNNIDINHILRNKDIYLINWEKSKLGIPIYDIYNFYLKYSFHFDFAHLLEFYESRYPLLKEEKLLFYIMISIPDMLYFNDTEINNCKKAKNIIDFIYRTEVLISKDEEKKETV